MPIRWLGQCVRFYHGLNLWLLQTRNVAHEKGKQGLRFIDLILIREVNERRKSSLRLQRFRILKHLLAQTERQDANY